MPSSRPTRGNRRKDQDVLQLVDMFPTLSRETAEECIKLGFSVEQAINLCAELAESTSANADIIDNTPPPSSSMNIDNDTAISSYTVDVSCQSDIISVSEIGIQVEMESINNHNTMIDELSSTTSTLNPLADNWVVVCYPSVHILSKPNENSEIIGHLNTGQVIELLLRQGNWLKHKKGWSQISNQGIVCLMRASRVNMEPLLELLDADIELDNLVAGLKKKRKQVDNDIMEEKNSDITSPLCTYYPSSSNDDDDHNIDNNIANMIEKIEKIFTSNCCKPYTIKEISTILNNNNVINIKTALNKLCNMTILSKDQIYINQNNNQNNILYWTIPCGPLQTHPFQLENNKNKNDKKTNITEISTGFTSGLGKKLETSKEAMQKAAKFFKKIEQDFKEPSIVMMDKSNTNNENIKEEIPTTPKQPVNHLQNKSTGLMQRLRNRNKHVPLVPALSATKQQQVRTPIRTPLVATNGNILTPAQKERMQQNRFLAQEKLKNRRNNMMLVTPQKTNNINTIITPGKHQLNTPKQTLYEISHLDTDDYDVEKLILQKQKEIDVLESLPLSHVDINETNKIMKLTKKWKLASQEMIYEFVEKSSQQNQPMNIRQILSIFHIDPCDVGYNTINDSFE